MKRKAGRASFWWYGLAGTWGKFFAAIICRARHGKEIRAPAVGVLTLLRAVDPRADSRTLVGVQGRYRIAVPAAISL
jgi:hypothetical protein